MKTLLQFGISVVFIFIIDFLWLGFVMKNFYRSELGSLARTINGQFTPIIWAAVMVYVALALGVTVFVLPYGDSVSQIFINGAILGFVIYAVYDFTNLSILQNYSLKMTLVDVAWGTFLCGTASLLVHLVSQKLA